MSEPIHKTAQRVRAAAMFGTVGGAVLFGVRLISLPFRRKA